MLDLAPFVVYCVEKNARGEKQIYHLFDDNFEVLEFRSLEV